MHRSVSVLAAAVILAGAGAAPAGGPDRLEKAPSRFAKVDGHKVHYKNFGAGKKAVVLVHGWSSDGGRMAPLARHLVEAGVSCLLVDLPGHGRTGTTRTYHAALMVEDLRAVADYLAARADVPGNAALLGYSFGGVGAIVSASTDPRWTALVVMATPLGPMEATEIYLRRKGLPDRSALAGSSASESAASASAMRRRSTAVDRTGSTNHALATPMVAPMTISSRRGHRMCCAGAPVKPCSSASASVTNSAHHA